MDLKNNGVNSTSLTRYSVLMPVYYKENPEYLRQSISSMTAQTIPPDDFVVVCDGPLTVDLDLVLSEADSKCPGLFRFLRMPQNEGLGVALQKGLPLCKNELVARMDSDDISDAVRCELQLAGFARKPELALLGGQIEEFEADPCKPYGTRLVPLTDTDIRRFSKKRNPFNHMTVMFKKSAVLSAGNYKPCALFEDYYLWIRMLENGAVTSNLPHTLVKARAGMGMISRRGGIGYAKKQINFQRQLLSEGYITCARFIVNCAIRVAASLLPYSVRRGIYNILHGGQKNLQIF